jgi:hypothetical protein
MEEYGAEFALWVSHRSAVDRPLLTGQGAGDMSTVELGYNIMKGTEYFVSL